MAVDWSKVLKNHIDEACRRYDDKESRPTHPARTTFPIRDDERHPAKFIRGLAYEIATGTAVWLTNSTKHSGAINMNAPRRSGGWHYKVKSGDGIFRTVWTMAIGTGK